MDKIAVSREDLCRHYGSEALLQTVFADIEAELKLSQVVVCRFIVNGIELNEQEEIKFAETKLTEVHSLEFFVEQTYSLLRGVTSGWIEEIPKLIENTEKLAIQMRQGDAARAIKPFYDLVENCGLMSSSLNSLVELGGALCQLEEANWAQIRSKLEFHLLEGYNFIEKKDYLGLADVLEYELIPCFETWLVTIKNIETKVNENQDELKCKFEFEESQNSSSLVWTFRSQ